MKRLLALVLAVTGVGWTALSAGKLYDHPTWAQMERAIAAAEGVPYVPRQSSKTDPTFDQMERLIKAVGSGGGGITNAVTLEAFAYATNHLALSKVGTNEFHSAIGGLTDHVLALEQRYLRVIDFFDTFESDADWYAEWADEHGYCTSMRYGNVYVRNYDWKYTEAMTYVGRLHASSNRYASVFVCNVGTNLTPAVEGAGEWTRFHRALPGRAVDGINEQGVVCNINVVPLNGADWETRGTRDLSLTRACRYVLDHFDNARAAAEYVAAHGYVPDVLEKQGLSVHMMIADDSETYIVEDGEPHLIDRNSPTPMTNYRVVSQTPDPYGSGHARYGVMKGATQDPDPEKAIVAAIRSVWYTHAYVRNADGEYPWPDEFAGTVVVTNLAGAVTNVVPKETGSPWEHKLRNDETGLLQETCHVVLDPYADIPHDQWPRNGLSWQTIHCSVYDISNRCLRIAVQEKPQWTVVSVPNGGVDELIAYGTNYVNAVADEIKRVSGMTERVLTAEQIASNVTFEAYGANQNSAIEIGHGAAAALSQEFVSSVKSNKTLRSVGVAIGAYAAATNADPTASSQAVAIGFTSTADGGQAVAIGAGSRHYIGETNLDGDNAYAHGSQSIAIGYSTKALAGNATAIGSSSSSAGLNNDKRTSATALYATAIGYKARGAGKYAVAVGSNVKASGEMALALGSDATATGVASVQIGPGTNTVANTLKFQDVTIVKDGHVTGSVPDPKQVYPTSGPVTDAVRVTVDPGSMTTIMPTKNCGPGTEIGVSCSAASNRNYTVFFPNTSEVREGLPGSVDFDLPSGTIGVVVGPWSYTTLPCRFVMEQPYAGLVVVNVTPLDDGYDWTPSVTNHTMVYRIDAGKGENRLVATNSTMSILGESLHCATNVTLTYLNDAAVPQLRTVPLLKLPAGKEYMAQTYYGYAGHVNILVSDSDLAPKRHTRPDSSQYVEGTLTYGTIHGAVTTNIVIEVELVD